MEGKKRYISVDHRNKQLFLTIYFCRFHQVFVHAVCETLFPNSKHKAHIYSLDLSIHGCQLGGYHFKFITLFPEHETDTTLLQFITTPAVVFSITGMALDYLVSYVFLTLAILHCTHFVSLFNTSSRQSLHIRNNGRS